MNGTAFLLALALLPAIILCAYVYKKDRVEKEPIGLLLKLFVLGALICFPAAFIEGELGSIIKAFFSKEAVLLANMAGEKPPVFEVYAYVMAKHFIGVALVEEGLKFLILVSVTRRHKAFNSLFDGMIYAIFVSLGFAALENVFYVLGNGLEVGIMRAVMSVPGHMFFAVLMGYYYAMWHMIDKAAENERILSEQGVITKKTPFTSKGAKVQSLLMPILAHGFYNSCCTIGTNFAMLLLFAFLVFMYIYCFGKIKKMSKIDNFENVYIGYMLVKKYPELSSEQNQG